MARNYEKHKNAIMANNERYRQRNREIVMSRLLESKCVDCGEDDPLVLQFDHVVGDKDVSISLIRE